MYFKKPRGLSLTDDEQAWVDATMRELRKRYRGRPTAARNELGISASTAAFWFSSNGGVGKKLLPLLRQAAERAGIA